MWAAAGGFLKLDARDLKPPVDPFVGPMPTKDEVASDSEGSSSSDSTLVIMLEGPGWLQY